MNDLEETALKRKKTAGMPAETPQAPAADPAAVVTELWKPLDTVQVCLFGLLLFLAMTVQTGRMTMILTVVAFVAALPIGRGPIRNLRARLCVPVLGLLAFALMQGLAAIYSDFGSYSVREYYKFLAAFALAVIVLVRFEKKHVRGLLWAVVTVSAVIGLVCVDMASSQHLFNLFANVTGTMGADYYDILQDSLGSRVNGIYRDANITGALMGMAILAGVYLTRTARKTVEKALSCVALGVCAVSFLVAMSRGAILCFALAALCYLLFAGKEDRLSLFFFLLALAVSLAFTGLPAMLFMTEGSLLPPLLTLLCGVVLVPLNLLAQKVSQRLAGHGKAVLVTLAVVVVAVVAAVLVAFRVTGPFTFTESGYLLRSTDLAPGDYTLTADYDGAETTSVQVYVCTPDQVLLQQTTPLYEGLLRDAAFTVPDGVGTVFFRFQGAAGDQLRTVTVSDGTALPLRYRFIPELVAERFQIPLFEDYSYMQRVQYLKDGWKLFTQSPLVGQGLGSTEGLLTSVQPYYYESKYLHNHVLQVMDDTGLLGLASFLTLMLGAAWLLLRGLRKENRPLAAMLLACLVMMNAHSAMEINFSIRAFECLAYSLLAIMLVAFAEPLRANLVKIGGWVLGGAVWLYLAVFGGLLMSHRSVEAASANFSTSDVTTYMNTLQSYVSKDVFVREDFQISYVAQAAAMNDSRFNGTMRKYAEDLRDSGTYPACSALARYYFLPRGEFAELFAVSREGIAQEASAKESWNYQFDFYRTEVLPAVTEETLDAYLDGVLETSTYLDTFNQDRLEAIELSEENQTFLGLVESVREGGLTGQPALALLQAAVPAESAS